MASPGVVKDAAHVLAVMGRKNPDDERTQRRRRILLGLGVLLGVLAFIRLRHHGYFRNLRGRINDILHPTEALERAMWRRVGWWFARAVFHGLL